MKNFKQIKGYKDYMINQLGEVLSLKGKEPRILKHKYDGRYLYVGLSKDGKVTYKKIHRLLAETFLENKDELPCVNHIDGDKKNNNLSNLEWCDYSHNAKHMHKVIINGRGTASKICKLYYKGELIAEFENISKACQYAKENFGVGFYSLQKYLKIGECEIVKKV